MKLFRVIAIMVIFTLTISPALAAICATTCASQSTMSFVESNYMADMKNCHEGSKSKDQHKSTTEHKSCTMGAGCNFSQVTPIESHAKYVFTASAAIVFPSFNPSGKSVDLSPPLKPPA